MDVMDVEHAIQLAKEHLAGKWLEATSDTVSMKTVSGGCCSSLYLCEDITGKSEPSKFLIRILGGKAVEEDDPFKLYNQGTESIVFFMHGHLGYGPKLYGVFDNGRLEEYIPSKTLDEEDLKDSGLRKQIARKLARFHSMKLPVPKNPFPSLQLLSSIYKRFDTPAERRKFLETSDLCGDDPSWEQLIDFPAEIEWLSGMLQKVGGRLVLSINDMNDGNVLIRDTPDTFGELVTLIDYEIGGTNWRGFDMATHFLEWNTDPDSSEYFLGVSFRDIERRREFITEYLNQSRAMDAYDDFDADGLDSCDHVLMEADLMAFLVVLYWVCVTLKPRSDTAVAALDVEEQCGSYGMARELVKFYVEHKPVFVEMYKDQLK